MAPLTKTCPKMVLSHKGGSLCVKDVFAKKIFWCRERFRWGRLRSATASIQNGSSRLLISQYFLPESDPTERFRDTLGNKGFSAACDPTARCDLRSSIGDGHVHHMGSSSPANVSSKPASHLSNSAMVL